MQTIRTTLRFLVSAVLALILLFEEWGWEPLARLMARLARLPVWARLERWIARLPRWGALLMFGVPMVALFPVKLGALYLFAHGQPGLGLVVLVGAKLVGTAVLARLFQLTQPALMQFEVFARWYPRWKAWKDGLLAWVRASDAWQWLVKTRGQARAWWANVARRFRR